MFVHFVRGYFVFLYFVNQIENDKSHEIVIYIVFFFFFYGYE